MQIFSRKNAPKNPNLILAALKLIEMMSIVQLEEFYINQWVFVFDCKKRLIHYNIYLDFGLTIEPTHNQIEQTTTPRNSNEPTEGVDPKPPKISNFIYQPYFANVVQDNLKIDYRSKQIDIQDDYDKMDRKIVMTMTNVIFFKFLLIISKGGR